MKLEKSSAITYNTVQVKEASQLAERIIMNRDELIEILLTFDNNVDILINADFVNYTLDNISVFRTDSNIIIQIDD